MPGRSKSPAKKPTLAETAMAKAKARRASKSPAPKRKPAAKAASPAATRGRSKSPAPKRKPAAAAKKASPAATRGRSKSPAPKRKPAAKAASPAATRGRSKSPAPKRKPAAAAKKASPAKKASATATAMAKAAARRASKSPAPKRKAAARTAPSPAASRGRSKSPTAAAAKKKKKSPAAKKAKSRTPSPARLRRAAAAAAEESFFEDDEEAVAATADGAGNEDAEAAAFQRFMYVVVALIALTLYLSPAGPAACDGVSLSFIVKGAGDPAPTIMATWKCAAAYNALHPSYTLALICGIYVALQTCAIPGPVVLAVVAGGLYGFWGAQLLNAVCAGTGATFCALLSKKWGRGRLRALGMEQKVAQFRAATMAHEDSLFTYMLMTRVTPVPNVVVNMASPHLGVPLWMLAVTTPIGQFLFNCVWSSLGMTLGVAADKGADFGAQFAEQKSNIQMMMAAGTTVCALFLLKSRAAAGGDKE
jgi:uncharacterized membrane protein YdjX (TVP38/TMEM64 family)